MSDISEGPINILKRATGFLSFWDKMAPANMKLEKGHILVYIKTDADSETIQLFRDIDLTEREYQIRVVSEYDNCLALVYMVDDKEVTEFEFQTPSEKLMISWMKYIVRSPLELMNELPRFDSLELVSNFNHRKSVTIGRRQLHKRPSLSQIVHTIVVVRRILRVCREKAKNKAAQKIQARYRAHRQRKQYRNLRQAVIKIQSRQRMRMAKVAFELMIMQGKIGKLHPSRTRIITEIYTTEENYVEQLEAVCKIYLKPLKSLTEKAGITSEQVNIIFCNIDEILEYHKEFLAELKPIVADWNETSKISPSFMKMTQWLTIYTKYCNNFDDAKIMLSKCHKNPQFMAFLNTVDSMKALKKQDLDSFLILPVQRIPRYELLLKDVIKKTWPSHPDLEGLERASQRIKDCAKQINRSKSYAESKHRLLSLQTQLSGSHQKITTASSMGSMQFTQAEDLEADYIGEGPLMYAEAEKVMVSAPPKSAELDIDSMLAGDDNEGFTPHMEIKSVGPNLPIYAFLFRHSLVLTKRSKPSDMLSMLSHKKDKKSTFKYGVFLNISLERAAVELQNEKDNRKEIEPTIILTEADGKIHKLIADSLESKKKWFQDIKEALEKQERVTTTDTASIGRDSHGSGNMFPLVTIEFPDEERAQSESSPTSVTASQSLERSNSRAGSRPDLTKLKSPAILRKFFKSSETMTDGIKKEDHATEKPMKLQRKVTGSGLLSP
eukprot:Partr_v1_DN27249_c0_g1_i1_m39152 putative FYVE, RhoGEF and PH domain containing